MVFAVSLFNDPQKTAGLGLALSIFNMATNTVFGLMVHCEILTANVYGQKDLRLCGIYLNRGFIILNFMLIGLLILFYLGTEQLMLSFGQKDEVIKYCIKF